MDLKKIGKALLFPHMAIILILVPIALYMIAAGTNKIKQLKSEVNNGKQ